MKKQEKLLKNINKSFSFTQKQHLEAPITVEELTKTVSQLKENVSPGYDGISAEFYKTF